MKKQLGFYYLCLFLFVNCNSPERTGNDNKEEKDTASIPKATRSLDVKNDTAGFFTNCQELISHRYSGNLQGVDVSQDSIRNFCFVECFDCKETFQIIFIHNDPSKREEKNFQSLTKDFESGCNDYFKNFKCFSFVYPMKDPDKQKDPHALPFNFPLTVKAYERLNNDTWRLIGKKEVDSFKEFANFQFRSIYHLN